MKKKTGSDYYTNRHSCFLLQYHIVLVTKYRHPVLAGGVKEAVYERIRYVAESRGFNILELNGEADHVHLLIEADPQTSPGELVNVIKTQTSRRARKLYGDTLCIYHIIPRLFCQLDRIYGKCVVYCIH